MGRRRRPGPGSPITSRPRPRYGMLDSVQAVACPRSGLIFESASVTNTHCRNCPSFPPRPTCSGKV